MDTYQNILLLVVLIMLSGFFSASETALTSFRSIHLEKFEDGKNAKKVELLKKWLKNPNEMLTGLLVGNNIVNILASSIATVVTINIMGGTSSSSVAVATVGMTIIILIFGEITPKIIAKNQSVKIAGVVVSIIYYFAWVLKPIIKILMMISKFIGRLMGIELHDEGLMITEEDIISFVNVGEAEGIIEEEEKEMIHSIVGFGETTAKEVMTPRTSMFALEGEDTLDDVWDEIIENGFSRIPVYEDTIDNIIGVLYVKDILSVIKNGKTDVPVKNFVRPGYFVPETKPIDEIFKELQANKMQMAIVVDEYGGTAGVLTMEDILEELVGNIFDEYDDIEFEYKKLDENTYLIDGSISLYELKKILNVELPEGDYETLSGYLIEKLGRLPEEGEYPVIEDEKLTYKIQEYEDKRIRWVKVCKNKQEINENKEN